MKIMLIYLLAVSAFNTGLIWLVQLVHYPGFAKVGKDAYQLYQEFHMRTISFIVAPSMFLELLLSIGLLFHLKTIGSSSLYLVSVALLLIIWINTAFWAIPVHNKLLNDGLDVDLVGKLVSINWWRTISWSLRTIILVWLVFLSSQS